MTPEERLLKPLDLFPIVKSHIKRQPVKCHDGLYKAVHQELKSKGLTIEVINNKLYHDKMIIESDLHDLIEYFMEEYYFHREDIPND